MIIYTKSINSNGRKVYKKAKFIEIVLDFFARHETLFTAISFILLVIFFFFLSIAIGNPASYYN